MNNNERENGKKDSLLVRFKSFVKKNKIRLKAGAAAAIVAGSIGVASWEFGKDNSNEDPNPSSSIEQVDPSYRPGDEEGEHTHKPGGEDEEHTHKPGEENDEHTHKPGESDGEHTHKPGEEDTTTTNPSKPTGEEDTTQTEETHTHKFSSWTALDSQTEVRTCSCGEVQTRQHTLGDIVVTYKQGEDDTHLVTTSQACKTCNYKTSTTVTEDCHYILSFDENFEYLTCTDCEKEKTRSHVLDAGTDNLDGTITYHCTNEGCEYAKTIQKTTGPSEEEHVHNYTDPVISYIDMGDAGHIKVSTQTCTNKDCPKPVIEIKDEKATPHVYSEGVNSTDPETGKPIVIYTCKDCGHQKIVEKTVGPIDPVEHTHNYNGTPVINYEQAENGHIKVLTYTCIDPDCPNKAETKVVKSDVIAHSYDREHGIISEDGKTITYKCECGHTITEAYTKPPVEHTHNYTEQTEYENITVEGHDKVLVKVCSEAGCPDPRVELSRTTESHIWDAGKPGVVDGKEGTIYTCACGHTKFVEKTVGPVDPIHNHTYDGTPVTSYENVTEEGHTKVLTYTCTDKDCPRPNETKVVKTTEGHSYTKTGETRVIDGITYEVEKCACGKEHLVEKQAEHTHNYTEQTEYENITEEGHDKVLVKVCSEAGCPDPRVELSRTTESHIWDAGKPGVVDGKEGTIYTCACGHTKFVEKTVGPVDPIHNHTYDGTPVTSYENVTEEGHTKVLTYTCTDKDCPRPNETKVIKTTEGHSYTKTGETRVIDGVTYEVEKCACGKEHLVEKQAEHTHNYTETTEYENITTEGHDKVLVKVCSEAGCPEPRVELSRTTEGHSYTKTGEIRVIDGVIYEVEKCACGKEHLVEKQAEHTHNYTETTEYENVTAEGHERVTYNVCKEVGCPEPKVELSRIAEGHSYDGGQPSIVDGKEGTIYTCACGHTKFVEKTEEHTYVPTGVEKLVSDEDGHYKVAVHKCSVEGCTEHADKEVEIPGTRESHTYRLVPNSLSSDKKTEKESCSECGHTRTVEHIHSYTTSESLDPETGEPVILHQCYCGDYYTEPINKHEYVPTGVEKLVSDEDGHYKVAVHKCSVEGCTEHADKEVEIPGTRESHTYRLVPNSLSSDKKTEKESCSECGHTRTVEHIHSYTSSESLDPETGEPAIVYQCYCGDYYTEPINKHEYAPTGVEKTVSDEDGHYKVQVQKCSVEGCTEHAEIEVEIPGTRESHTYRLVPNSLSSDKKTEKESCSECGHTRTVEHIHSYTSSESLDPETGEPAIVYQCYCGDYYTEPINKHEYAPTGVEKTVSDEDGHYKVAVQKCSVEGCTEHGEIEVEIPGTRQSHSYRIVSNSISSDGKTEKESCSECGHTRTVEHIHSYTSSESLDPETGEPAIVYQCNCGDYYVEPINKSQESQGVEQLVVEGAEITDETQVTEEGNKKLSENGVDQEESKDNESQVTDEKTTDEKQQEVTEEKTGEDSGEEKAKETTEEIAEEKAEDKATISSPSLEELMQNSPTMQNIVDSGKPIDDILNSVPSLEEILSKVETVEEILAAEEATSEEEQPKVFTKNLNN